MNEPYQRVSQNNSLVDGGMIGAGIGALATGGTMLGAGLHYRGIEGRVDKTKDRMLKDIDSLDQREAKATSRYNDKMDKIISKAKDPDGRTGRREAEAFNRNRVEKPLEKLETKHQKNLSKIRDKSSTIMTQFAELESSDYLSNKQSKHMYSKMGGGFKKAAIVGASAVIGGAVGVIGDHYSE